MYTLVLNHSVPARKGLVRFIYFLGSTVVEMGSAVAQQVERWTCDQQVWAKLRNNLGRVVYTYVPRSPSSITWYRPRGGNTLRLGR